MQLHNDPVGGHLEIRNTTEKVRERFYWVAVGKDVEHLCRQCTECTSRKAPAVRARALMISSKVGNPFGRVAVDILGQLPITEKENKYIMVVADYFTRWV